MAEIKRQKRMTFLIWGSILFFTALYVSLIFNQNVWTDEIFTMKLIRGGFQEIVEGTAKDVHPPLYYFTAKAARLVFGNSLQVQKAVTLIPMTLTLILGATKVRRHFGNRTALFYIWFLGCIPCSMEYAVQVRMYSMALLAVTACGLYAYESFWEEKKRAWAGLVISALAAAYLHYFAFGSVIIINGILFLALLAGRRDKLGRWFLAAFLMIAGYLPWFPVFVRQFSGVSKSYWIPEITAETVAGYFQWAFGIEKWKWPAWVCTILCVLAGMVMLTKALGIGKGKAGALAAAQGRDAVCALLFMLVPALTGVTGVILSFAIRPIYRDQYVFPAVGLLCLFLAIATAQFADRKTALIPVCAFVLFLGAAQYQETWHQEYKSTLTDQTLAFWRENVGENDLVVYNLEVYEFCYSYYFPKEKLSYVRDVDLDRDFDNIWFLNTPGEWEFVPPQIIPYDLQIEYVGHFGIEHNEFDIYRVTKGPNPQPLE